MKKYYYFTLIALLLPMLVMAQVSNADNFNVGDQLHYMVCTMPDSPGSAGTAVIWDFSSQQDSGDGQRTTWVLADTVVAGDLVLSSTPYLTANGTKIHKTATQNFMVMGMMPPATYTYDAGVLMIDRNLSYGLVDSNAYTSTLTIATNNLTGSGTSKIVVDGSGTVKTPVGTFNNVLRVKRITDNIDSITGTSLRNYQVAYLWYDNLHTAALFRIDSLYRTGTGFLTATTITTGTAQYLQAVFPANVANAESSNPSATANLGEHTMMISATLINGKQYTATLFDIEGRKLHEETFTATGNSRTLAIDKQLTPGTYIVTVDAGGANDMPIVIKAVKE